MDKKDTSLVSFLSMKLWEYYPRFIKDIVAILFLQPHLAMYNYSFLKSSAIADLFGSVTKPHLRNHLTSLQ
jgi:hypothetical protein